MKSSENSNSPIPGTQTPNTDAILYCPTPPSSNHVPDVINLLDYIEVLVKNCRIIISVTCIAAVLSIVFSLSLPNIYKSTALILPPQQDTSGMKGMLMASIGGMGGMAADLLGKGSPADLYVRILNSEAMGDMIIDRFNLMERYEQKYRVDTYKLLDHKVNVSAGKKDGIISISVEDKDPKLTAEIANAYVEELGRLVVKLNITGAGENRIYLEARLAKANSDLVKAEDALKLFQTNNKALDIPEQTKGTIKGVADLEGQLAAEEVKLAGIRRILTDSSQEVKNLKMVIANIKEQIAKFEGNRSRSSLPGVASVPELGQQYLRLMREFKIQENIVEQITKQYEMSKLSEAKEVSSIQVIQSARQPDKKSKPKRSLIIMVTTIAAGFGTVLYVFIREFFHQLPSENRERWDRIRAMLPHTDVTEILCRRFRRNKA